MSSTFSDVDSSKSWEVTSIEEVIGDSVDTEYESSSSSSGTIDTELDVDVREIDSIDTDAPRIATQFNSRFIKEYMKLVEVPEFLCSIPSGEKVPVTVKKGELDLPSIHSKESPVLSCLYPKENKFYIGTNSSYTCPNERKSRIPVSTNPLIYRGQTCICSRCRCNHAGDSSRFASISHSETMQFLQEEKEKIRAAGGFKPITSTGEEKIFPEETRDIEGTECTCGGETFCNTCALKHMKRELEGLVNQIKELRMNIPGSFSSFDVEEA